MYLAAQINALLMIGAGVFLTFYGFRKPTAFAKGAKIFRICGPVVLLSGTIFIFAPASPIWARQSTDDGFASVEFPGIPTRNESVGTVDGVSRPLLSYKYNVPGQDISLILSSSPVVGPDLKDDQHIDAAIAYLSGQGWELAARQRVQCGDMQGYFLRMHLRDKNATSVVRLAIAHNNVYRALATFTSASETQEEIRRFIESFQVRGSPPNIALEPMVTAP
jgi:hypothetical protein